MNAKEHAERLVAEGWRVLPIRKDQKVPLVASWRELMMAGATQSLDAYAWNDARADALGIITGTPVSGSFAVVAVDLDKITDPWVVVDALRVLGLPEDYRGTEATPGGRPYLDACVRVGRRREAGSQRRTARGRRSPGPGGSDACIRRDPGGPVDGVPGDRVVGVACRGPGRLRARRRGAARDRFRSPG